MAGKPGTGGGLSSKQIRRMEENRRLAQQRLSNKRVAAVPAAPLPEQCAPPPAKRLALNSGPPSQKYRSHEHKIIEPARQSTCNRDSSLHSQTTSSSHRGTASLQRPEDSAVTSHSCRPTTSRSSSPSGGQVGTSFSTGSSRHAGRPTVSRETFSTAAPSSSTHKVSDLVCTCVCSCCICVGGWVPGLQ